MAENSTKANIIARVLFIIGGIILFILLAIFIIRMVPVLISNISNAGSSIGNALKGTSGEKIVVTSNTDSVDAGSPVVINFEYEPVVEGQYFVSYACADGLLYDIQSASGPKRIICNTPFRLGENLSGISLVPIVTKPNIFIDSNIKIEFKDTENNSVDHGTKIITVKSEGMVSTTEPAGQNPFDVSGSTSATSTVSSAPVKTPTTSTTQTSATQPSSGYTSVARTIDLVPTYISQSDIQSTFVIHVYNKGTVASGPWEFTYTDANNPSTTILSPVQASLGAGQGMAVTVRFGSQRNSSQAIAVSIDPYNRIYETNEFNNQTSVVITGYSSGNTGGGSQYTGRADLVIDDMEVGRISGRSFVRDSEIDEDDTAAVRFVVTNDGGTSTGSWRFEIDNLPYTRDDSYRSGYYSSLAPGQSIEIVVEFEGIDRGTYSLQLDVDSDDDVTESDERNNDKSKTLKVTR